MTRDKTFLYFYAASWNTYDVLQVDAFYSPEENIIAILGGILQFPFYGKGLESLNYGAIGAVLGHEFTHGFDSNGKDFTKDGKKKTWWSQKMLDNFNERAECFVKQYGNFSYGSKEVNGEHTLAENIADNGGVREAYKAYQNHVELHGPELGLPGLEEFSSEQLLFLSFANIWCETEGPGFEIDISEEHSPQRFRVLGTLANSPEFSSTWKCHSNSKMNSSPNRCIIW